MKRKRPDFLLMMIPQEFQRDMWFSRCYMLTGGGSPPRTPLTQYLANTEHERIPGLAGPTRGREPSRISPDNSAKRIGIETTIRERGIDVKCQASYKGNGMRDRLDTEKGSSDDDRYSNDDIALDSVDRTVCSCRESDVNRLINARGYHVLSREIMKGVPIGENNVIKNRCKDVIIDSGATGHMFPWREVFKTYTQLPSNMDRRVHFGDSSKTARIIGVGDTCLVKGALYVPELSLGIVSISKLDDANYEIVIRGRSISIIDNDEDLVMSGTLHDGLYKLDLVYCEGLFNAKCDDYLTEINKTLGDELPYEESFHMNVYGHKDDQLVVSTRSQLKEDEMSTKESLISKNDSDTKDTISLKRRVRYRIPEDRKNLILDIHRRYGHLSEGRIKTAYQKGLIVDKKYSYDMIKDLKLPLCPDCMKGRMKARSHGKTTNHSWKIFEKIAVDYKGPFKYKSRKGFTGFYLFSDYRSDYLYAYPTRVKSDFEEALSNFWEDTVIKLRHLGENPIQILQSDSDAIIESKRIKRWLSDKKIQRQVSSPYRHSENGQIERDVGNVMDRARTVMAAYDTPKSWWWHAIEYAIWCINRSPTSKNDNQTPLEQVECKKPLMEMMVPFFCPGFYHVTKEERTNDRAWDNKGRACRMVGYSVESRGYDVLDIEKNRIMYDRSDCVWDPNLVEEFVKSTNELTDQQAFEDNRYVDDIFQESDEARKAIDESKFEVESDATENGSIIINDVFTLQETDILNMHPHQVKWYVKETKRNEEISLFIHHCMKSINPDLQLPPVPRDEREALASENSDRQNWYDAILIEIGQFEDYKIFNYDVDQSGHGMKTKFVFTCTFRNDYTIKYKARLVVCGYSQIHGIDYDQTYSPTVKITIVFIMLFLVGKLELHIAVCDVTAAFLEGKSEYALYCYLPECISRGDKRQRVQIIGNMYGEKQAPLVWYDHLNTIMENMGCTRCPWDACVYYCEHDNEYIIIAVHVDDMILCGTTVNVIQLFYEEICIHLRKVTIFWPNEEKKIKYLSMDIILNEQHYVKLSQRVFINEMGMYNTLELKSTNVPMSNTMNLRNEKANQDNYSLLPVTGKYRFLCDRTRPDILTSVGEISTGGAKDPSDSHVKVAKQIYMYLKHTMDYHLRLGGRGQIIHFAFSDAAYITVGRSKSRLGYCQFLGMDSGCIQATSINDTTISHSSMEAEIKALDACILSVIHIRNLMEFVHRQINYPTIIFIDSKSAIDLVTTLKINHKSRHINMRINFIRRCINDRIISIHFISSEKNVADTLTKPLSGDIFKRHSEKLLYGFSDNFMELQNIISK